jgi:hypothetical protein
MDNVNVDIYVSQVIRFFESNPQELHSLIGQLDKETFFEKIKEQAEINYKDNDDACLTRQQMIDIIVKMHNDKDQKLKKEKVSNVFQDMKFGQICLN